MLDITREYSAFFCLNLQYNIWKTFKTGLLPNVCVIRRLKPSNMSYMLRFQSPSGLDIEQNPWFLKATI